MPVHSQELPLGGQDWNHGEGCLQIQFGHEGSFVKPAEERHSMVDGGVVEGEFLSADDVVKAVVLCYRAIEDHPPLICIVTISNKANS